MRCLDDDCAGVLQFEVEARNHETDDPDDWLEIELEWVVRCPECEKRWRAFSYHSSDNRLEWRPA